MTDADYEARLKSTGRNDPCPCGSSKKYKKCHLAADEKSRSEALAALAEEAKAAAAAKAEEEEAEGDGKAKDRGKLKRPGARNASRSKGRPATAKPKSHHRRTSD